MGGWQEGCLVRREASIRRDDSTVWHVGRYPQPSFLRLVYQLLVRTARRLVVTNSVLRLRGRGAYCAAAIAILPSPSTVHFDEGPKLGPEEWERGGELLAASPVPSLGPSYLLPRTWAVEDRPQGPPADPSSQRSGA